MKKLMLIAALTTLPLLGAPAFEHVRTFVQPDGTVFEGKVRGDEHLHWIETSDGTVLVFNKQSAQYEHAKIAGDALLPNGREFRSDRRQTSNARNAEAVSPEALHSLWMKRFHQGTKYRELKK